MNGDNNLREILPLLRPRSAEPTLFIQVVWYLLWIGLAVLVILYVTRWIRHRRQRLEEFTAAAREAGLDAAQTRFLYDIARGQKMRAPPRLLSSPQVFDRQLGAHAAALAARDRSHPDLATIGAIRQALGFDELGPDQSLTSTRQIDRAQTVMMRPGHSVDDDLPHTPCLILERDEGTLTLAPVLREGDEQGPRWKAGQELSGIFWREGDTEYRLTTHVIGRDASGETIDVEHAPVERLQNRDFYRIDVDFTADFYLLDSDDVDGNADGITTEAAIDLLDETEASDLRVAPAAEEEKDDPLSGAPKVTGHVVNLSAGGLAVDVPERGPEDQDRLWVVDPAFDGPFPLAGLRLRAVGKERVVLGARRVKLTFDDLPTPAEKAIVRGVYEHQLQSAGGRSVAPLDDVPPGDEDDLPVL